MIICSGLINLIFFRKHHESFSFHLYAEEMNLKKSGRFSRFNHSENECLQLFLDPRFKTIIPKTFSIYMWYVHDLKYVTYCTSMTIYFFVVFVFSFCMNFPHSNLCLVKGRASQRRRSTKRQKYSFCDTAPLQPLLLMLLRKIIFMHTIFKLSLRSL